MRLCETLIKNLTADNMYQNFKVERQDPDGTYIGHLKTQPFT